MNDKILLTYMGIDVLFVITGGLLIIFALTTKNNLSQTLTADNVATDLLLAMCPLNGELLLSYTLNENANKYHSGNCQCSLRLFYLPRLRTSNCDANNTRLAKVQRLPDCSFRPVHHDHRSHDLV
jgi:hypothetical protein